jgi:hypothetical protein
MIHVWMPRFARCTVTHSAVGKFFPSLALRHSPSSRFKSDAHHPDCDEGREHDGSSYQPPPRTKNGAWPSTTREYEIQSHDFH